MKTAQKIEMLFGIHPVNEAIKAGRRKIYEIYLAKEKSSQRLEDTASAAEPLNIPISRISSQQLTSLTASAVHQGIAAKVGPYPMSDTDDIFRHIESRKAPPFLLLADGIEDTQNLGALIRTALCAGVHGIIIPKDRAASPTPAVSKASAGASEVVRIAQVTNVVSVIQELKDRGLWIMGMDGAAKASVFDSDLSGNLGIVIGSEDKGIRPLVRRHCDVLLSIPQANIFNSLNASAAGAVVMYEAFRQRYKKS
ncbi:MAG: 23S rRNA (guanosine(2251)-2'-O)-methyltransferase RlmB [Desulfobacteraceae bacterium]|nr:23S rRNA (guanosine(2251)-2'-O)-methyltransferase RlmB [Desulfobacteraceae bacterium]